MCELKRKQTNATSLSQFGLPSVTVCTSCKIFAVFFTIFVLYDVLIMADKRNISVNNIELTRYDLGSL
jgi:hypothetical protein